MSVDSARVVASFERANRSGGFLTRFYELFLASSPEVAKKFASTDFERQRGMLRQSLHSLLLAPEMEDEGGLIREHMEAVAARHSRADLDIPARLYDLWLDCLIGALREHDPELTPELETAWRVLMGPGIEFMRARYREGRT